MDKRRQKAAGRVVALEAEVRMWGSFGRPQGFFDRIWGSLAIKRAPHHANASHVCF